MRDSDHLDPGYKLKKNFEFPKPDQLKFDTHVIGFTQDGSNWGLNIIMSNGSKSMLPMPMGWNDKRIDEGVYPKKVGMWYNYHNGHSHLNGIQYFDADNKMILDAGNCFGTERTLELAEGERLIGCKSYAYDSTNPQHSDFQFVIGKL